MDMTEFVKNLLEKKILKCGICGSLLLESPVYLKDDMENVCFKCYEEFPTENKMIRNLPLEYILSKILLPCKFFNQGCNVQLHRNELENHHLECKYRVMECLMAKSSGCSWEGPLQKFENHFVKHHYEHIVSEDNDLFLLNVSVKDSVNIVKLLKNLQSSKTYFIHVTKNKNNDLLYSLYTSKNIRNFESHEITISHVKNNAQLLTVTCKVKSLKYVNYNTTTVAAALLKEIIGSKKIIPLIIKINNDDFEETLSEYFDCPVCNDILRSPIYQCKTGHSICHACKSKLQQCPTCRGGLSNTRNYFLETLSEKLLIYNCVYKDFGCEERLLSGEVDKHERNCFYSNKHSCPTTCGFKGAIFDLVKHFSETHEGELVKYNKYESFLQVNMYNNPVSCKIENFSKYLIDYEGNIFHLSVINRSKGFEWTFKALRLSSKLLESQYSFEIGITNSSGKCRKFINKNLISEKYYFDLNDVLPLLENCDTSSVKTLNYYCKY